MSGDRDIGRRFRELRAPDEAGAERRAWEIIRAADAEQTPPETGIHTRRVSLALAGGLTVLAVGLSPAGAKVGDLVSDVIGIGEENAKPALRSLPAAGSLLVESEQGVWVVRDDGSKRLLGDYGDAAWSPNGLYVVAADDRELVALEPDGTLRWTYPASGDVHSPRWAGNELDTRISYRSGDDLRVIAGDGDPESDRLIARDVAPIPPAWRPVGDSKLDPGVGLGPYVLSYVERGGKVRTVNAETGRPLPTTRQDLERLSTPPGGGSSRRALSPDGSRLATLKHGGGRDRLTISRDAGANRTIFAAPGVLSGPTWSPDGRWLLVGWAAADQWLFIEVAHPARVVAFDNISRQFEPGGTGPAGGFPRVSGWVSPQG